MEAEKLGTIRKYEVVWRVPKWKDETWRLLGVFKCLREASARLDELSEELPHCKCRIQEIIITRKPISS